MLIIFRNYLVLDIIAIIWIIYSFLASTCKDPGTLLNGYRYLSSTTVKSIVKYKCKPGYYLIGSSYQVCLANGKWSGVFPKCLGK